MKGSDILRALSHIDEELIQEVNEVQIIKSKAKFKYGWTLVLTTMLLAFTLWTINPGYLPNAPTTNDESPYTLYFNKAESENADQLYIQGHFWNELNTKQIDSLFPNLQEEYSIEGTAHYSHIDDVTSLFSVEASIENEDKSIQVTLSPTNIAKCYVLSGKPLYSEIEGIQIEAGIFTNDAYYIYYADFRIEDVAYYVEYSSQTENQEFFTKLIADIILNGKADFTLLENPKVPLLKDEKLNEKEAYSESDFGAYLPHVPNNYSFNSATRLLNQTTDFLSASWSFGYNDIRYQISHLQNRDKDRIVSIADTALYDMSLYPIPWADSMPEDKREIIENPIFKSEDLTLDTLELREYVRGEQNDPSGNSICMRFGVLYDDILVEVVSEGIDAEYMYKELQAIQNSNFD